MRWLEETHGVQFELIRHFLRRMWDGEWSSSPGQWRSAAIGVLSLLLPAGLLLVREGAFDPKYASRYRLLATSAGPSAVQSAAMADQIALLTLLFCVTGLIALLEWQSLFPSGRDYLTLASLPVRPRQVFAARLTAVLLFSALIITAMNFLPSLLAPVEFGGSWRPDSPFVRQAGAQAITSGLGCFFIFFAILALQGVLLNVLPANWLARTSALVQGGLAGLFLLGGFSSWSIKEWSADTIARLPEVGTWLPPVWFAGLHEHLTGSTDPFFLAMAGRAVLAAGVAVTLAILTYCISYRRHRKLLLEAPTRLAEPGFRRWSLLRLIAGSPRREAVMEFMAKTLARSRAHRLMWLVYLGGAAAVVLNSSLIDGGLFLKGGKWTEALQFLVVFWPLACSVVMVSGFRHVLSIPAELRANWIFQIAESQGRAEWMSAVERFVFLYAIAPIYLILFPVAGIVLGWPIAIRMTSLQLLISLSIFELLFHSWQKLPFTCSYVPGKRPIAGIVGGYFVVLTLIVPILSVITATAGKAAFLYPVYLLVFGGAWLWFRRLRCDGWGEAKLMYEDFPAVVTDLGIKELTYAGTRAQLGRTAPGDAGHADIEDSDSRPAARLRDSGIHPADIGGCTACGGGSALSGAAPAGTARPVDLGVGSFREQSPGQVLPTYGIGAQEPVGRDRAMETNRRRHRPHYGTRIAEGEFGEFAASVYLRLRALVKRRQLDRDLEDELRFHLSMREEQQKAAGGSDGNPGDVARRQFGNVASIQERCRELWTFAWFETLWQDLQYAARQLRRSPSFAASAAITLALGIGATTAVFSMLDGVLWRPVPLPDLKSLVFVCQAIPGEPHYYSTATPGDIEDVRRETNTLENLASWHITRSNIVDAGGEALVVESARVSPNLFGMLGVQAALGRTFEPGEDQPGREQVAILSDSLWRRRFAANPEMIGRTIRVDSQNFTVVGVMPPEFQFPRSWRDLWIPLVLTPREGASHSESLLESAGRLKPGATRAQAAAELDTIAARLEKQYPETNRKRRFVALPFNRYWYGDFTPVWASMMLGASLFVLLLACTNVANLQFARGTVRASEMALRAALGSGRVRLIRQLLTESLALASLGAVLGLVVAACGLALIKAGVPLEMRHYMAGWEDIGLNWRALGFAAAAMFASAIVAGMAPAWRCVQVDLTQSLKEGGHGSSAGRTGGRWRAALVSLEVGLATVLLVGSVLMVHGFRKQLSGNARVQPASILTFRLGLGETVYRENRQVAEFYSRLLERAAAIPGVQTAVAATGLPYSRHYRGGRFSIQGRQDETGEKPSALIEAITPEFFKTLFVPLRAGRFLNDSDGPASAPVAVISEGLARRWWRDGRAVGDRIYLDGRQWVTVAGVVGDLEYSALNGQPSPAVYVPYAQFPSRGADIGLRLAGDPMRVAAAVRTVVRELDPELPVTNLNTMDTLIRQETFGFAVMSTLMGIFGLLALLLAAVGAYGVTAYSISARTYETAVRMALGARRGQVISMLFRRGIVSALAGLALGLVPAWALARLMQAFVWGVKAADPAAFVGVPLLLTAVAAVATYMPARRAARIEPVRALRHE